MKTLEEIMKGSVKVYRPEDIAKVLRLLHTAIDKLNDTVSVPKQLHQIRIILEKGVI